MKKGVACFFIFLSFVSTVAKAVTANIDNLPLTVTPSPATTENSLTGSFDITSNYVFRGISQSDNLPAFQGGFMYTFFKTGIYFSLWGSNVKLVDPQGQNASVEVDSFAGIKNSIGENINYDLAIVRYSYPKASGLTYNELLIALAYKIVFLKMGYSSNVFNSHETGVYSQVGVDVPIPSKYVFDFENVSFVGGLGHYKLPAAAGNSYSDYLLQLTKKIKNYTLSLQWTDTNGNNNLAPLDDPHIVGTVAVDF